MSPVTRVVIGTMIMVTSLIYIFTDLLPRGSGFVLAAASGAFLICMLCCSFKEGERRRQAVDAKIQAIVARAARSAK